MFLLRCFKFFDLKAQRLEKRIMTNDRNGYAIFGRDSDGFIEQCDLNPVSDLFVGELLVILG